MRKGNPEYNQTPETSKLSEQMTQFTAAWDERQRTFNALRDLNVTDDVRKQRLAEYKAAAENFEKLRGAALK